MPSLLWRYAAETFQNKILSIITKLMFVTSNVTGGEIFNKKS
jgi:hypothetical protein